MEEIEYFLNACFNYQMKNPSVSLDYVDLFYKIASETEEVLAPFFQTRSNVDVDKLTKMTLEEKLEIVNQYFKEKEIEFDIEKYIKDGTIDFIDYNQLAFDFDFQECLHGRMYKEKGINKKLIDVSENGFVIDMPLFVHEISHFRDEPLESRNKISALFSETLAYAEQFIFMDYLSELGFFNDMQILFKLCIGTLYNISRSLKKIAKIILTFKKIGSLEEKNYQYFWNIQSSNNKEKEKDDYEKNLTFFKENLDYKFGYQVLHLLGYYLATYLLNEYKKNPAFIENIKLLHEEINKGDFYDCLKLMNLQDLGESDREKILEALMQIQENYFQERGKVI